MQKEPCWSYPGHSYPYRCVDPPCILCTWQYCSILSYFADFIPKPVAFYAQNMRVGTFTRTHHRQITTDRSLNSVYRHDPWVSTFRLTPRWRAHRLTHKNLPIDLLLSPDPQEPIYRVSSRNQPTYQSISLSILTYEVCFHDNLVGFIIEIKPPWVCLQTESRGHLWYWPQVSTL